MTIFERLISVTETARAEQELPDFLAREVAEILRRHEEFAGRGAELEELIDKIAAYDTYGQTGYLGMGVNHVILQQALNRLLGPGR